MINCIVLTSLHLSWCFTVRLLNDIQLKTSSKSVVPLGLSWKVRCAQFKMFANFLFNFLRMVGWSTLSYLEEVRFQFSKADFSENFQKILIFIFHYKRCSLHIHMWIYYFFSVCAASLICSPNLSHKMDWKK